MREQTGDDDGPSWMVLIPACGAPLTRFDLVHILAPLAPGPHEGHLEVPLGDLDGGVGLMWGMNSR